MSLPAIVEHREEEDMPAQSDGELGVAASENSTGFESAECVQSPRLRASSSEQVETVASPRPGLLERFSLWFHSFLSSIDRDENPHHSSELEGDDTSDEYEVLLDKEKIEIITSSFKFFAEEQDPTSTLDADRLAQRLLQTQDINDLNDVQKQDMEARVSAACYDALCEYSEMGSLSRSDFMQMFANDVKVRLSRLLTTATRQKSVCVGPDCAVAEISVRMAAVTDPSLSVIYCFMLSNDGVSCRPFAVSNSEIESNTDGNHGIPVSGLKRTLLACGMSEDLLLQELEEIRPQECTSREWLLSGRLEFAQFIQLMTR